VSQSLRTRLGSKAPVYLALLAIAALGVLLFDLFMQRYLLEIYRGIDESVLMHRTPLHQVRALTGWGAVPQVWLWSVLPLVVLAALAVVFECLVWFLRMDPTDDAWTSLTWAVHAWKPALPWMTALGLCFVVAFAAGDGLLLGLVPVLVLFVVLPFLALAPDQLGRDRPVVVWLPRWPGWLALGSAVACLVVMPLLDAASEALPDGARGSERFVHFALVAALWWLGLVWTVAWMSQWLSYPHRAPSWRRIHAWRVLAPVVVQQLRALVLGSFVAVPILLLAVLLIFYIPQIEFLAQERGGQLPQPWFAFAWISRWTSTWWWVVVLTVVPWFALTIPARLLVQLGFVAPTPPTHPDCDPAATTPPTA